jgi:exosortase/archaeosortase family protein
MSATAVHLPAPRKWPINRLIAPLVAGAGILLLISESHVRHLEAGAAAGILRLTALGHAHAVGSSVIFPHHQLWIGYTVAASCTAALLIAPFFLIAALLILSGRVRIGSGLLALAAVTVIVWLVNQLRLLVIGASMRLWGFQTGYSRSHVLAGGVVSTLGVALGIAAFVALMLHERSPGSPSSKPS